MGSRLKTLPSRKWSKPVGICLGHNISVTAFGISSLCLSLVWSTSPYAQETKLDLRPFLNQTPKVTSTSEAFDPLRIRSGRIGSGSEQNRLKVPGLGLEPTIVLTPPSQVVLSEPSPSRPFPPLIPPDTLVGMKVPVPLPSEPLPREAEAVSKEPPTDVAAKEPESTPETVAAIEPVTVPENETEPVIDITQEPAPAKKSVAEKVEPETVEPEIVAPVQGESVEIAASEPEPVAAPTPIATPEETPEVKPTPELAPVTEPLTTDPVPEISNVARDMISAPSTSDEVPLEAETETEAAPLPVPPQPPAVETPLVVAEAAPPVVPELEPAQLPDTQPEPEPIIEPEPEPIVEPASAPESAPEPVVAPAVSEPTIAQSEDTVREETQDLASIQPDQTSPLALVVPDQQRLIFKSESASLSNRVTEALNDIAGRMQQSDERLQIRAYAKDANGRRSASRRLSLSRALAIRSYLIEKGIDSSRIDVRALGIPTDDSYSERADISFVAIR